ncbi:MAG: matrixin family metalloprotease [Candidatus Woesearchaeota archaeon]
MRKLKNKRGTEMFVLGIIAFTFLTILSLEHLRNNNESNLITSANPAPVTNSQSRSSLTVLPEEVRAAIAAGKDFVDIPVTPELSRAFFIDYSKAVHVTPLGTDCGPDSSSYKLMGKGLKWFVFPISYNIDPSGSGIDPFLTKQAVVNGMNSWDAEEHPTGGLFVESLPAKVSIGWNPIDGPGGALAVTSLTYMTKTKEIVSATVSFDSQESWTQYPALSCTSQGSAFDIENVAAHEIGHVIGLDHVRKFTDQALTMWPYAGPGETFKRTLGTGDKKGIDALY